MVSGNLDGTVDYAGDSSQIHGRQAYPLWRKILLIFVAILYSGIMGTGRFLLGAHSLNQVIFGWLLGAWLAFTWFTLIREHVHKHVNDLVVGRTSSSMKMYLMLATSLWIALQLCTTITFLIVKDDDLNTLGQVTLEEAQKMAVWDYWKTWSATGYLAAVLGAYYGLVYQNKKYGGQLFIQ